MIKKTIKTAICDIIVVLLFCIIIVTCINIFGKEPITAARRYISMFETIVSKQKVEEIKMDPVKKRLSSYPLYESQYASLIIEKIGVNLPIYYGTSDNVLKLGVGQSPNGYFPGEGGSIICMAHNFSTFLKRLGELQNGDIIIINTGYGNFEYEVFEEKIVAETNLESTPIQSDEEILYLFTCYPFNNIGYTYDRYLVSAKLVKGGI